jgi:hypothetical protein
MPRRRDKQEWKMICDSWKQSDLNQKDFCQQNHVSSKSLSRWSKYFINSPNNNDSVDTNNYSTTTTNSIADSNRIKFHQITKAIESDVAEKVSEKYFQNNSLEITLLNGVICKAQLSESNIKALVLELLQ